MLAFVLIFLFLALTWGISLWAGIPWWIPAAITALTLLVVAARFAWKRLRAKQTARQIERSLVDQAEAYASHARPDRKADVRALQGEFEKAVSALKASNLARGGESALYALPWYVIVGPPGAGKSTALRNSGLNFPYLTKRGAVRGIGGTRNCDWWLSNEAVILDTAGRYVTEDDDHEEWLGFLRMLRATRVKRPINGIMLAISIADLGAVSEQATEKTAQRMREKLDEIIEQLGVVAPVYVLFTKCDLLPGFIETFGELRRGEREQVWGFALSPKDVRSDLEGALDHHFAPLTQVLERRALARMRDQRSLGARERAYEFSQQFESLLPQLREFIREVFVQNVYRDTPMLRGVYFTSGTQEGSPIDRVMRSVAAAFGFEAAPVEPSKVVEAKSYFLGELFRSVMFPDANLAHKSSASIGRTRWIQAGIALAALTVAAGVSLVSLNAYAGNAEIIGEANDMLAQLSVDGDRENSPIPLESLDPAHALLASLQSHADDGAPVGLSWGLYQGHHLLPVVRDLYTSTLRGHVVARIYRRVAQQLGEQVHRNEAIDSLPSVSEHAQLYDMLRTYLLLSEPKQPNEPALEAPLRAWLAEHLVDAWAASLSEAPEPAERARMLAHAGNYLELAAGRPDLRFSRDEGLVRAARAVLARVPTTKLAVDRITAEIEPLGWDVTVESILGSAGLPVQGVGRVQGAFTRRAWDEKVRDILASPPEGLLGEAWVLEANTGSKAGASERDRLCRLNDEYFERYIQQWKQFVGSLRVEEPQDNDRSLVVLQDLTRGQPPPLQRVMRIVSHNARLDPKPQDAALAAATQKAAEQASGLLDRLKQVVADTPAATLLPGKNPCAGGDYVTATDVKSSLRGFYSFGVAEKVDESAEAAAIGAQLTSVEVYQEQLTFVRDALQTYLDDPATAEPLMARLSAARTRVRGLIESQEVGWRPRFDALLWPAINGAFASSAEQFAGERGSRWCTSVVLPFNRTLRGRYPFSSSGQDAALEDLIEFYRPQSGVIWSFYDAALARDILRVGDRFEPKGGVGIASLYNADLVHFLNRSLQVSTVMFPRRGEAPQVDFEIRVRPSPGIASVLLNIDGQAVDFHNGPEKWIPVRWPGSGEKRGADMRVVGAGIDETLRQDGEWGWFRLLDRAIISVIPGQRFFTARWKLRTQSDIVIDVRPARAENPFMGNKAFLEAFRSSDSQVPERIAGNSKGCSE